MSRTTVVNANAGSYMLHPKPDDVVYIGRPSAWGNPFVLGRHGTREEVIEMYRIWIKEQPHLLARLHTLRGKKLVCFCAPKACHGDVLAELADDLPDTNDQR